MTDTSIQRNPARLRVLVVDDDPLSAAVQSQLLRLLGHDAQTETDGSRVQQRVVAEGFDLVLLDLGMPVVDGFAVLQGLREHERIDDRPPLPVIAVTGYVAAADRERCLEAGFNGHLHKPVLLAGLQAQIAAALGNPDAGGGDESNDATRLHDTVQRLRRINPVSGFSPTVTEAFALRSAQLLDALRTALEQNDGARAIRAAQTLASSARFLGATALADCAAQLEALAAQAKWDAAFAKLREFDEQHQAVLTVLFQIDS